jgi:hypothetical protein
MRHGYTPYRALFSKPLSSSLYALKTTETAPFPANFLRTYTQTKPNPKPRRKETRSHPPYTRLFPGYFPHTVRNDSPKKKPLWNVTPIDKFIQILKDKNLKAAVEEYPKVSNILSSTALRAYLNLIDKSFDQGDRELLDKAVTRVCGDFIRGVVVFDGLAIQTVLYLLRILGKYGTAKKFWDWADTCGEPLPLAAYTAAIQTLSDSSINEKLDVLEGIYERAREADVGTFAEYHLSHNAILRNRKTGTLPSGIHPRSIHLLTSIARARLLHGNWKDGYLAYDSACRLSPSRPKFFYEAMLDPGRHRSFPETYRLARIACREGIKVSPWKLDILLGNISHDHTWEMRNAADFSRYLKYMKANLNLMLANLDIGGEVYNGHINKLLSPLKHLLHPESSIYCPNDPHWTMFSSVLAESGAKLLEKLLPLTEPPAQIPHEIVLKLALKARHKELFYITLQKLFAQRGKPTLDVARSLVEAAGYFGSFRTVTETWEEVVKLTEDHGNKMEILEFQALSRATKQHHSEEATEFLKNEAAHHNYLLTAEDSEPFLERKAPLLKVNLPELQRVIVEMYDSACYGIDQITSKTTDDPVLTYLSTGLSIDTIPLGYENDLWKIYDEISVDPVLRKSPEYEKVEYHDLEKYPQLRRRFLDWVAVTELMADAEEHESSLLATMKEEVETSKSSIENNLENPSNNGQEVISVALESPPRFTSFEELRQFVWRLRDLHNTFPLQTVQ